jgi:hypothetical protein
MYVVPTSKCIINIIDDKTNFFVTPEYYHTKKIFNSHVHLNLKNNKLAVISHLPTRTLPPAASPKAGRPDQENFKNSGHEGLTAIPRL